MSLQSEEHIARKCSHKGGTHMSNTRPLQEANTESNRLTREAIRTGLIMLMHNNKYDRITVTDIIKRAACQGQDSIATISPRRRFWTRLPVRLR